ncbi:MAG: hypothetical protein L0196_06850 [candidate division Zixibacteria bacterium]|nr:hypothetical protein [candidate division Zixibacteria bacterium]
MSYVVFDILSQVALGLFLIMPPTFLFVHYRWKPRWHPVFLFLGFIVLGWLLLNVSHHLYYESLFLQVGATPNPSDELRDRMQSDGAANVFTLLFGWLFAAIYFTIWFALFRIGQWAWKRLNFKAAAPSSSL